MVRKRPGKNALPQFTKRQADELIWVFLQKRQHALPESQRILGKMLRKISVGSYFTKFLTGVTFLFLGFPAFKNTANLAPAHI